jgi:hypothetical protein
MGLVLAVSVFTLVLTSVGTFLVLSSNKFGSNSPSVPKSKPEPVASNDGPAPELPTMGQKQELLAQPGNAQDNPPFFAPADMTFLANALTRARSNPNSDPQAINDLEFLLADAAESAAAGGATVGIYGRVTFITADGNGQQAIVYNNPPIKDALEVIINNVTGAAIGMISRGGGVPNPDGSRTWTAYDFNDKLLFFSIQPAPNPAAPAPTPQPAGTVNR